MKEPAFRYRYDPAHASWFGLAILHAIATDPDLDVLRRNLALKGGAALLLVYGSGRASRHDLDFDVRSDEAIERRPLQTLLARLREPWNARLKVDAPSEGFEIREDALNVGPIEFASRRDPSIRGALLLQISRRRIPPHLAELIRSCDLKDPDGRPFSFPIASPEVIGAEKLFRSVGVNGPHLTDLYDLGYVLTLRPNEADVSLAFRQIWSEERHKVARDQNDRALRDLIELARKAARVEDLFRDARVVDPSVSFDLARARILAGAAWVRETAGLPPIKGVRRS